MRTRVQNALHAIVLAHGVRRGHTLWNRDGLDISDVVRGQLTILREKIEDVREARPYVSIQAGIVRTGNALADVPQHNGAGRVTRIRLAGGSVSTGRSGGCAVRRRAFAAGMS